MRGSFHALVALSSILFAPLAMAQSVTNSGSKEGMVSALSGSAVQFGCEGSVAMELADIRFANDSAQLLPDGQRQMDTLAQALLDDAFIHDRFVIEGHASAPGSDAHNMDLSERRSGTVKTAMITRGMADYTLTMRAFGERRLLYPRRPDHPHNRRVTVRRMGPGSAILDATRAAAKGAHRLTSRLMVAEAGGAYWAKPDQQVIDRSTPVYLCLSASRSGLLTVEIREEGKGAFRPVGTWPLPEGGLVRVPQHNVFKFTAQPRWQEIRLRHVDCSRAACPRLANGIKERIEIDRGVKAPDPVAIGGKTLPDCKKTGVVCEIIRVRHE